VTYPIEDEDDDEYENDEESLPTNLQEHLIVQSG
jgi:hypothetical protein